jgi:acyl carrier protein
MSEPSETTAGAAAIADPELRVQLQQREAILARVRRILIDRLKVPREPEEIDPDTPLFGTGLHLDSVDAVELVVAIEGELGLTFDEEEVGPAIFRTVSSVVDAVIARGGLREQG